MVVIGGTGTRWGALVGGVLYTYANQRLGDASSSHAVSKLPSLLRTPLEQPLFVLGVLFILVVFFVPGGLTQLGRVRRPRRSSACRRRCNDEDRLGVDGCGAPVLLIQGLGYARWGWDPVVPALAQQFRVLSFDNRGIGESDKPAGPYTARMLADDALQVLDEAGCERRTWSVPVLAGWSPRRSRLLLRTVSTVSSSAARHRAALTRWRCPR